MRPGELLAIISLLLHRANFSINAMSAAVNTFTAFPRNIIVDDSDPAIQYNGAWHRANETETLNGIFQARSPIFSTLHVLNIFNGSFSYNFTGEYRRCAAYCTRIQYLAGTGISVFATPVDNSNYTVQCFLDGNQLDFDSNDVVAKFGQSKPVCQAFGFPDGTAHTFTVTVSVPPRAQEIGYPLLSGFAFDYILIQVPPAAQSWYQGNQDVFLPVLGSGSVMTVPPSPDFSIVQIETGERIANGTGKWNFDPENGFLTNTPESQVDVMFIGA